MVDAGNPVAGIGLAAAAYRKRRKQRGLTQAKFAELRIISVSSLIAFERGRVWPRERTRAKLEEAVGWPAGTLDDIRLGGPVPAEAAPTPAQNDTAITDTIAAAMTAVMVAVNGLPVADDPRFVEMALPVLAGVRQLQAVAARAVRASRGSAAIIAQLVAVRRLYDDLMARAAASPSATLGHRLYAARRAVNIDVAEAAAAVDVTVDLVRAVENEEPITEISVAKIETLIGLLLTAAN